MAGIGGRGCIFPAEDEPCSSHRLSQKKQGVDEVAGCLPDLDTLSECCFLLLLLFFMASGVEKLKAAKLIPITF